MNAKLNRVLDEIKRTEDKIAAWQEQIGQNVRQEENMQERTENIGEPEKASAEREDRENEENG